MCTAFTLPGESLYFGRNMDLECGFGEAAPRRELLLSIQSGGGPEYLALAAWRLVGESENRK